MGEWFRIGMKQIIDRDGYPRGFYLARYEDGLWLHGDWTSPGYEWRPDNKFIFRLRKPA